MFLTAKGKNMTGLNALQVMHPKISIFQSQQYSAGGRVHQSCSNASTVYRVAHYMQGAMLG